MKITISAVLFSFIGLAASRCFDDEADRFGVLTVTPSTFRVGDTVQIDADLTCGIQDFGIVPQFLDYLIEVLAPNNNGFELPVVLARRAFPPGALTDSFSVKIPNGFSFNTTYTLIMNNIAPPAAGADKFPGLLVQGGTEAPINLIVD